MTSSFSKLETLLKYKFGSPELLKRALTHRSWANENHLDLEESKRRDIHNERLEFVGDSVLGLAVADELYILHPELSEGDLTLMKHHLVSTETLARIAKKLKLGSFMLIGRGEEKTGGRKKQAILADTMEAVIGAVFYDSGYASSRRFVIDVFFDEIVKATPKASLDYKTLLQETLQGQKRDTPTYRVVKTDGPPHNRLFTVEVEWDNGSAAGEGNTIKSAEMKAAGVAMIAVNDENFENNLES